MDRLKERRDYNASGIFSLWWNWVLACGALTVVVVCSFFVSKQWLPFVTFGLNILLIAKTRRDRTRKKPTCNLICRICGQALLWSAICMVIINLMHSRWFEPEFIDMSTANRAIPYVTILVLAPCTFITAAAFKLMGRSAPMCMDCYYRQGSHHERGFLGLLFSREADYQVNALLVSSAILSAVTWIYYFEGYINVNLNRQDLFFFRWFPVMLYALSLGFLGMRCLSLWSYYCRVVENNIARHGNSTLLRFLIICGNHLLLKDTDSTITTGDIAARPEEPAAGPPRLDTPASVYVPHCERSSDSEASQYFRQIAGPSLFRLRFLYDSPNFHSDCNILHFACFLDRRDDIDTGLIGGSWFTLNQLKELDGKKRIAPALVSEISRLYTIGTASKTYDKDGRRRYQFKEYRPAFHLSDLTEESIDFNDTRWLTVSSVNEDRPLYHLKRLWRKYVSGIGQS